MLLRLRHKFGPAWPDRRVRWALVAYGCHVVGMSWAFNPEPRVDVPGPFELLRWETLV